MGDDSMVMAAKIIVNEILYLLQNYFGKIGESNLQTTIVGFYDDDEVYVAKEALFAVADQLKPDIEVPRFMKRKVGDNKRRLDCEDLFGLWKFLDKTVEFEKPVFAAVKAHRIPSFNPSEVDVVSLTQSVMSLKQQLEDLKAVVDGIKLHPNLPSTTTALPVEARESNSKVDQEESAQPASSSPAAKVTASHTFADLMRTKENGEWKIVSRKPKLAPEPARRLVGSGAMEQRVKAVPTSGPKSWHVYVGRMTPTTTEDDICDFLKDWQIDVSRCTQLKRREKWHEKFAAFHVTIDILCKDAVFDSVEWPCGADVRDWVFKEKSQNIE